MFHFTFSFHSLSLFLSSSLEALWLSNFKYEFVSSSENTFLFLDFGEPCVKPEATFRGIIYFFNLVEPVRLWAELNSVLCFTNPSKSPNSSTRLREPSGLSWRLDNYERWSRKSGYQLKSEATDLLANGIPGWLSGDCSDPHAVL